MVKNLPAMQETRAQSLGREDPLEESMATLSSILAWEIPWREDPGGLQSTGSQKAGLDLAHMYMNSGGMLYSKGCLSSPTNSFWGWFDFSK